MENHRRMARYRMTKVVCEEAQLCSSVQDRLQQGETGDFQRRALAGRYGVMKAQNRMVTGKTGRKRWMGKKLEKDH